MFDFFHFAAAVAELLPDPAVRLLVRFLIALVRDDFVRLWTRITVRVCWTWLLARLEAVLRRWRRRP